MGGGPISGLSQRHSRARELVGPCCGSEHTDGSPQEPAWCTTPRGPTQTLLQPGLQTEDGPLAGLTAEARTK